VVVEFREESWRVGREERVDIWEDEEEEEEEEGGMGYV
jgi:hypothetical protein